MDLKHNPRINYAEIDGGSVGAILICDCGLWIYGSVEDVGKAYRSHIRVTDPVLFDLLSDEGDRSECP